MAFQGFCSNYQHGDNNQARKKYHAQALPVLSFELQLSSASAMCQDMFGTNKKVSCCLTFLCITERWQ